MSDAENDERQDWNAKVIAEFRENGGKVGGMFENMPMVLLHTTGARSGAERVNPLAYRREGDAYVVFGSKAGAPTAPDWFHNLKANPKASIEVGTETKNVVARIAEGDERDRIWEEQKKQMSGFAEYEAATSRVIPVIILEPAG